MGVEIVLHQSDLARLRIPPGERLTKQRILALAALPMYLPQASSGQWLNRCEQRAGAQLFIFVMLFARLPWLHRYRHERVADQETRSFVKTDHRIGRVVGQGIQCENGLHPGQERGIEFSKAPGLHEMRFQVGFFNRLPTIVWEMVGQKPASTTLSASSRSVQRSWPSGASEQASAVILARCVPSMTIGRPDRGASCRQARPVAA